MAPSGDGAEETYARSAAVSPHLLRFCLRKYPVSGSKYRSRALQLRGRNSNSTTTTAVYREIDSLSLEQDRQKLISWLQNPEDSFRPIPSACSGTGKWLLDHEAYQSWCDNAPSILWCYGPPGVGKSLLASIVIRDLWESAIKVHPACITYHFCDFAERKQQNATTILRSLLRQVVECGDKSVISTLNQHRLSMDQSPSLQAFAQAFSTVCAVQGRTYVVLDAPDELENPKELLALCHSFVEVGCRVLVTSRDVPDLRDVLQTATQIQVLARREDLKIFVETRFNESDFRDAITGHDGFVDAVIEKANGM